MINTRLLTAGILSLLLVLAAGRLAERKEDWPPISDEEKAIKDCPQQPGAPAIYLYREERQDEEGRSSVHRRLKILTPGGKDYANIEIPFFKSWQTVKDLKARVVRASGQSQDFTGQVFEKTALRTRGFEVTVKAFALPDVDVGDIIEYRYKIVPDWEGATNDESEEILNTMISRRGKPEEGGMGRGMDILSLPAGDWQVQELLFTRRAKFSYTPLRFIEFIFGGFMRLNWTSQLLQGVRPKSQGERVELEMENIPGFEPEESMIPEDSVRMGVYFFFCDRRITSAEEYWKRECKNWQKGAEDFIGHSDKVAAESQKLVLETSDPIEKLKKLYERAQQIRNLSYEKLMTRKQKKEQKIKENRKAADVLERNYGLRSDITRTFVALARAAGFQAEVARVVTRDDKLFQKNLLSLYGQFDSELALVKVSDREMVFDPATPFCPMGLIHWSRTNTAAIRYSDKPPAFFTTPVLPPELALTKREVMLQLDLQGSLNGTANVIFMGQEALLRRLEHINSDKLEAQEALEAELAAVLPGGARVSLEKLENMNNNEPHIQARFEVTIPGIASTVGKRLVLPVSPFQGKRQHPFRHAQRKYAVYFPFHSREFNDIVITLPAGVNIDSTPPSRRNEHDFAHYSMVCLVEGAQKLHIQRDFVVKKCLFPVDQYQAIKDFFDQVRATDEEQIVLFIQ